MSGYTRVDNWLFDVVMPQAAPYTFKLVSCVVRQTIGWNRASDTISISKFQEMMGTSSRTTVSEAIQDAIDQGWIMRKQDGQGYRYIPVVASPDSGLSSPENGLVTSPDSGPETSPESGHTKEHNKDKDKQPDPIRILAEHFTSETGLFASKSNWADGWELPLRTLYERSEGISDAKQTITRAIEAARGGLNGKQYTITSPMSITTIAANLPANGQGGDRVKVGTR